MTRTPVSILCSKCSHHARYVLDCKGVTLVVCKRHLDQIAGIDGHVVSLPLPAQLEREAEPARSHPCP